MRIRCDWHIHSCLSPCADLEMSPSAIAKELKKKGITLAALTDHNTTLNCPSFCKACKREGIAALFGMELQTAEEIHVLCLFSKVEQALSFGKKIYELLPFYKNNPKKTGDQVYVNEKDEILGEVEKYLIVSAQISIDEIAKTTHSFKGLCIPAHIDRPSFSMISQFGSVVKSDWDALEVLQIPPVSSFSNSAKKTPIDTHNYPLITSSDAHYLCDIAKRSFELDIKKETLLKKDKSVSIEVLKKALRYLL